MGQSQGDLKSPRDQKKGHGRSNKTRSATAPKKAFTLENILTPNGMYPPEILELIMIYMEYETMLRASVSCKLWMQTSYQAAKRLYRREFDPSIDTSLAMDYREMYLKLGKAKSNLIKGFYWPEVLCSKYRSKGDGDVSYSFTTHNNDIVYNTYKVIVNSYNNSVYDKAAVKYNVETYERLPHQFNCLYVGETEAYFDFDDEEYRKVAFFDTHPIGQPKRKISIRLNIGHDRYMTGMFKNMDGSNQLLIQYDGRYYEVFDTLSGQRLLSQTLPQTTSKPVNYCFYKNYIARYASGSLLDIVDLTTKEIKYSFETPSFKVAAHMCDGKLAYARQHSVAMVDLETGKEIREVVIDTSNLIRGNDDIDRILAIAFDKWRLVVAILLRYSYHVVQIYDMNDDFKLLQTIHDPMNTLQKTQLELLPNGSIVVGDINLTVYHFDHPSLYEKITVGFYDDDKDRISMYKINAADITKVALEMLNITLDEISAVTINKQIKPETPFVKRMTCIFKAQQEFSRIGFLSAFDGWPKCSSLCVPFAFTNDKMINTSGLRPLASSMYRPPGFIGSCLIVFEEDVDTDNCWKFCKPQFDNNLEIIRPTVKKISVDYTEIDYYAEKEK